MITTLFLMALSLGAHPTPSFPKDWTSSIQSDIMISQGNYSEVKGTVGIGLYRVRRPLLCQLSSQRMGPVEC